MPAIRLREHRPGGEADHESGDAGGGEQADAVLTHRLEGHQRGADGHDDQERVDHAAQHAHLRHVLAGEQVVGDVEVETPQIELGDDVGRRDRDPADHDDRRHQQNMGDADGECRIERRGRQRHEQRDDQERELGRGARCRLSTLAT